ncbi:MAG: pyridoxamine 5'-phosphate oxidase family protein [Thermomicrobiales bacterium]
MAQTEQRETRTTPAASRPVMPGYGVPESDEGLLPWSHAVERLAAAKNYWVATADGEGQPHAIPVWGAWVDGTLYFGAGPRSARNLAENPAVCIHLESGNDVVIIQGRAEVVHGPDEALSKAIDDDIAKKYDWRPSSEGEDAVGEGMYALHPTVAYAWASFPGDATRWRF